MNTGEASVGARSALDQRLCGFMDRVAPRLSDEAVKDIIGRLQFEQRWRSLTPEELEHMNTILSPAQRKRIDSAKPGAERDELIEGFARAQYFRDCAWADWLNGVTAEKPFLSQTRAGAA